LDVLSGFRYNVKRQVKEIGRIKPDLVHAHGTERAYAMAGVASGLPCLVSIQGIVTELYEADPTFGSSVIRHWEQQVVRKTKYFTCRTNFDTGFVHAFNPQARVFTIHEAMNPVFFENAWAVCDSPRVLFVGSLEKPKGLADLLKAMPSVKTRLPDAHLDVIGGGGAYLQELRAICSRLGVEPAVTFWGQRTAEQIAGHHRQAQVFVLSSHNENSPNTLAEAMVSGMPVIATNVGGIPSMVTDGETGLLVPPRDPTKLAEAILRLLEHPAERARLGKNARQVARERHQPGCVAAQTVAAYGEILRLEGGGRG
jgi:glycosyltransferase involved in cell wall biosynthesis